MNYKKDAIESALIYINRNITILDSPDKRGYISQNLLNEWGVYFPNYKLKRGDVLTKHELHSVPSINGTTYGFSNEKDGINKIYLFYNNNINTDKNDNDEKIATFVLKDKKFVEESESTGGSNKKTKKTKSKRRTKRTKRSKRSKRSKRKNTRKYKMK